MPAKYALKSLPFLRLLKSVLIDDEYFSYYDIFGLGPDLVKCLPFSIRILLESLVRNCDNIHITEEDVWNVVNWEKNKSLLSVSCRPARVILQDFTGISAILEFAAMRDIVHELGGNPAAVNPRCLTDIVLDYTEQTNSFSLPNSKEGVEREYMLHKERLRLFKWASRYLQHVNVIPPGTGVLHQVNIESLAHICFDVDNLMYPDFVIGTDRHTTMTNGLGVMSWTVGGIEAQMAMMAQPLTMLLPEVVGYRITGDLDPLVTSTDIVLTITKHLRKIGVVGKFVEFLGPGVCQLSISDRSAVANMCPEYGALVAFFPVDKVAIAYLSQQPNALVNSKRMSVYLQTAGLLRDYEDETQDPTSFSRLVNLDLASIVPSCSGPKRSHDRHPVSDMKTHFLESLTLNADSNGFGISSDDLDKVVPIVIEQNELEIRHGTILVSEIDSCTNNTNPSVILGTGIMAKKVVELGLTPPTYVRTCFNPGSGVVMHYLRESGVLPYLERLGFDQLEGRSSLCLLPNIRKVVTEEGLVCCGVLSGNRNFENRINKTVKANYLISPLHVIAYSIAGRIDIDLSKQPIGNSEDADIYLRDIWPSRKEIQQVENEFVIPGIFRDAHLKKSVPNLFWAAIEDDFKFNSILYPWKTDCTYVKKPEFCNEAADFGVFSDENTFSFKDAYVLLFLGDNFTADLISPAGCITKTSPAARYLRSCGVLQRDFNSYGARRGNDQVMSRGTFTHIRMDNKLITGNSSGPKTIHFPTMDVMDVFDAAMAYGGKFSLIILAGKNFGGGSSRRDWAVKGPWSLGVRCILAESFDSVFRTTLATTGILPLQFLPGENANTLGFTGHERFGIPEIITNAGQLVCVEVDGGTKTFQARVRLDNVREFNYFRNGGVLKYFVQRILQDTRKIS